MKILIITADIGKTAPGIVFEKLIYGLSKKNEIHILTANYHPKIDLVNVKQIIISKKINIHPRISKLLISIFGVDPFDILWANKSINKNFREKFNYDVVCSFISFHNYIGLICGQKLSEKFNIKHMVYSVDAIPAPGWPENRRYFNGVKRLISKYLNNIDALFSANKQMLKYQLSTFNPQKDFVKAVIYNPSDSTALKEYPPINNDINYFLYTGGIYGVRKSKYLLMGFEKYIEIFPNSKLVFVGTKFHEESFSYLKDYTKKGIEIHPFTRNLDHFYSNATALIDIDADIENDVFLSSKIINYLSVNRIIISETGKNSPSRELFDNCESIIQCDHDADQIFQALCKATELKKNISFTSRKKILEKFSINNISEVFEDNLRKLV